MIVIRASIVLPLAPSSVLAYVTDYDNDIAWRDGVLVMRANGPVQPRTTTYEEVRFLGATYVTEATITDVTPTGLAFRGANASLDVEGHRSVEPHADGARFTYELRMKPRGAMKVFSPLLRALYQRRVERDLQRLKTQLLEISVREAA